MYKLFFLLAFLPMLANAELVSCDSEIWNSESCTPMINSFKKDPYPYLIHITKTLDAAKIAIISGANRGLVPTWNETLWEIVTRANELSGYIEAQKEDPRRIRVKDTGFNNIEETSAFSGCYFLRDMVIVQDDAACGEYLAPAVMNFYVGMRAYKKLCGDAEEARNCEALAVFYK